MSVTLVGDPAGTGICSSPPFNLSDRLLTSHLLKLRVSHPLDVQSNTLAVSFPLIRLGTALNGARRLLLTIKGEGRGRAHAGLTAPGPVADLV